jgi:hypothetical protein
LDWFLVTLKLIKKGSLCSKHKLTEIVFLHQSGQAVQLGTRERLLAFCAAVQKCCPVGAYIRPVAGASAGYESEVSQKTWSSWSIVTIAMPLLMWDGCWLCSQIWNKVNDWHA